MEAEKYRAESTREGIIAGEENDRAYFWRRYVRYSKCFDQLTTCGLAIGDARSLTDVGSPLR